MQLRRKELNDILKEKCQYNNFIFIENNNIILKDHICKDGVHLNTRGSDLFSRNLSYYLNNNEKG